VPDARRPIVDQVPSLLELKRLGKNINGYFGETIDIPQVLTECAVAATAGGWKIEEIPVREKLSLLAFTRVPSESRGAKKTDHIAQPRDSQGRLQQRRRRIYISAGIHGDEPAGPLAIRELLEENSWPPDIELTAFPCLNPAGFLLNRRENGDGHDLNRQYLHPVALETKAHINWLERQPAFDLCLCLHEDWESHGFYIYELNPQNQPSLAESVIARIKSICPIDTSDLIEGRPAKDGIIRPSLDPASRPQWPESFFLITHKTRLSYTLEAPSDFPLAARVAALVVGVKAALAAYEALLHEVRG